jgi:hypothetical protein
VHEPEDAADAPQDTFVVAAQKVRGLRDPDRLRPWLYAVARNECLRRLRARARTVGLAQAGDVTDESVDPVGDLHREELRELVRARLPPARHVRSRGLPGRTVHACRSNPVGADHRDDVERTGVDLGDGLGIGIGIGFNGQPIPRSR